MLAFNTREQLGLFILLIYWLTDISKDNSNDCLECEWYGQLYCSGDIIIDLYSWKFLKKCADGKMGIYGRYGLWRITELIVTMQKLYVDHGKRCLRIPGLRWVFHYQASLLSLTIFINFLYILRMMLEK